nr:hypothetical protein [Tanacetum cinerariifolium]
MLGSIDCMHWEWRNWPKALHGQFKRRDHKYPTLMLEAVTDQRLWIWHAFFKVPGVNNDLNVLYGPPLFDDELADTSLECPFVINGHTNRKCYYLADCIYPVWSTFVKSFFVARDEKSLKFQRVQEAARKDIGRAFGVLQATVTAKMEEPEGLGTQNVELLGQVSRLKSVRDGLKEQVLQLESEYGDLRSKVDGEAKLREEFMAIKDVEIQRLKEAMLHEKAGRELGELVDYDLGVKAEFEREVGELKSVSLPFLDRLEALKDAHLDRLMAALYLEDSLAPTAEVQGNASSLAIVVTLLNSIVISVYSIYDVSIIRDVAVNDL